MEICRERIFNKSTSASCGKQTKYRSYTSQQRLLLLVIKSYIGVRFHNFLSALNIFAGTSTDGSRENSVSESVDIEPLIIDRGPFFDKTGSKNVTALVGKTAYLRCRVRNLSNKTVSAHSLT